LSAPKAFELWPKVEGIEKLAELALNLHWSWNHASDELWHFLDADLWEATRNPWVLVRTVSVETIKAALATPKFSQRLDELLLQHRDTYQSDAWFQQRHPSPALSSVAYFSMEFMLSEALPIYSGGLGNVAGDQMKAASDLGVPVTGIGLLYGQGYFRQAFDLDGRQQALYPINDPGQLPIRPLRKANGEWLRVGISFPGAKLWVRCWTVAVGRNFLYLLDTNDFANSPAQRGVTSELYGGDAEMRLQQEIVLGIGGWRLLRALSLEGEVCHLNEGHAALAVLERARCYSEDHKVSFALAFSITRGGNIFTTHTAVTAGFDRFPPELVAKYLGHYAQVELGLSLEELLALGRENAEDPEEPFNMAYLAVRGSGQVSGVSQLHASVSRKIFQPLFPRWPQPEVPIGSVTNGIHVPTWDSAAANALWTEACGAHCWQGDHPDCQGISKLSDVQLWKLRTDARQSLVAQVRVRRARQLASAGVEVGLEQVFDDKVLTLGFARRFATYKRPNLLLQDPERLLRLLTNPERPVQLFLAGKAHPQDRPGQELIKQWNDFIQRPGVDRRVVFLHDYDMRMAQELVQGMDLWINTPRRPWEACGTSGMKVLVNGGLNVSELDGWWAEAYTPEVGWSIGDGREHGQDSGWDDAEAEALYARLEREIVPEFYERGPDGVPKRWMERVRVSMAELTPRFSASRAVREYTEQHYLPAANEFKARSTTARGQSLLAWQQQLASHWDTLHFGTLTGETHDGRHFFRVEVFPGHLESDGFRVELFANALADERPSAHVMTAQGPDTHFTGALIYSAELGADRSLNDYTARVVPSQVGAGVPLESNQILWHS
jgi:starch phosphorylase